MSEKAIVPVTKETWQIIQDIAPVAFTSRMFGVTEQQAMIVMLKGHELGLGLASAFEFIHVIDSKPSISPKGALALIHQSGELAVLKIEDLTDAKGNPTRCKVTMKRRNGFEYTVEFSMADAERAGVVKDKSGWDKYPANMLRWRAVGYCADVVFPDVVGGLYRPEELGADVNEDGEPVATWEVVNPPQTPPKNEGGNGKEPTPEPVAASDMAIEAKSEPVSEPEAPAQPEPAPEPEDAATIMNQLVQEYGAPAVMAANDGKIPNGLEEWQAIRAKLQEAQSA